MSRIQVVNKDGIGYTTQVLIDGKPLDNVMSMTWRADGESLATVTLELIKVEVDVEGDVEWVHSEETYREPKPKHEPVNA